MTIVPAKRSYNVCRIGLTARLTTLAPIASQTRVNPTA